MKKLLYVFFFLLFSCLYGLGSPVSLSGFPVLHPLTAVNTITEQIRMNLYGFYPDGSTYTLDGTLTRYSADYSDDIDVNDSRKIYNSGENISMLRDGYNLIVECRQTIVNADTIFFRMWGMQKKSYRMEFVAKNLNHPGLEGYLEDSYLHSSTPINLNDTNRITIVINNDAASYSQNRFRIIFKRAASQPPHFTTLNADQLDSKILLNWATENEPNTGTYFVQKSLDGSNFADIGSVKNLYVSSSIYQWTDRYPAAECNYYRIRTVESSGKTDYSKIIKVNGTEKETESISVYPNPGNANNLNLKIVNQPSGKYQMRLINSMGNELESQIFNYHGGISIEKVSIHQTLTPGIYHLEIAKPDGEKQVISILF